MLERGPCVSVTGQSFPNVGSELGVSAALGVGNSSVEFGKCQTWSGGDNFTSAHEGGVTQGVAMSPCPAQGRKVTDLPLPTAAPRLDVLCTATPETRKQWADLLALSLTWKLG